MMGKAVIDARDAATLDAAPQTPADILTAIAGEEQAENEAIRDAAQAAEQGAADAIMDELVEGWQEACRHGADILTSMFDGLKPVWTPERMDNLGAALARADAHYGWGGAGKLLGHPLVGVGVAALPVVIGTVQFVKLERAKLEHAQAERRRQLTAAPAGVAAEIAPAAVSAAAPGAQADMPAPDKPRGPVPNIAAMTDRALAVDTFTP
jgi:hypothetical protein